MKDYLRAVRRAVVILLAAAAGWFVPSADLRAQTLRADYQFNNDLSSSVPGAGDLTELSGGAYTYNSATVNGQADTVLTIATDDANTPITTGGLQTPADPFANGSSYAIDLLADFTVNVVNPVATKVFDFASLTSDAGLYINATTGLLELVDGTGAPLATGPDAVTADTYFHLTLSRTLSGLVTVDMNGTQEFTYQDTTGLTAIAPGNQLGIFANDNSGVLGGTLNEGTVGDIADLQLFDLPVPEPSTWALLAGGGVALAFGAIRRRARSA